MRVRDQEGLNAGYVAQLLEDYLDAPASVPAEWRKVFEENGETAVAVLPGLRGLIGAPVTPEPAAATATAVAVAPAAPAARRRDRVGPAAARLPPRRQRSLSPQRRHPRHRSPCRPPPRRRTWLPTRSSSAASQPRWRS